MEAARQLGVSRQRVYQMVQEGKLMGIRLGGIRFVTTESLRALMEKRGAIIIPAGGRGRLALPPSTEGLVGDAFAGRGQQTSLMNRAETVNGKAA